METKIKKLPKWAQLHIEDLKRQLSDANKKYDTIVKMHAVLCKDKNREWFTINNEIKGAEPMKLWLIDKDHPFTICSLNPHDVLFIGRAPEEELNERNISS